MESDQSSEQSLEEANVWNEQSISLFDHQYCAVDKTKRLRTKKKKIRNNPVKTKEPCKNIKNEEVSVEIVRLDKNELDKNTIVELKETENFSILTVEQYSVNAMQTSNDKEKTNNEVDSHDITKKHEIINNILDDQQKVGEFEQIDKYMQDYVENNADIDVLSTYNNKINIELLNNDHPTKLFTDEIIDNTDQDTNSQYTMKEIFEMLCAVPASKQKYNKLDNSLSEGLSSSSNANIYEDFDLCLEDRTNYKGNMIEQTNKKKVKLAKYNKCEQTKFAEDTVVSSTANKKSFFNDLDEESNHTPTNIELDLPNDENENVNVNKIINKKVTGFKSTEIKKKKLSKVTKRSVRQYSRKAKKSISLSVLKTINTVIDEPVQVSNYDETYNEYSNLKGKNRVESIKSLSFDDCIEGLINDVKKVDKRQIIKEPIIIKTQNIKRKRRTIKSLNKELEDNSSKSLSCNICLANMEDHIELLNHLTEFHLEDVNMDSLKPDEYNIENDNHLVPINIYDEFSIDNVIDIDNTINTFNNLEENLAIEPTKDLIIPYATYLCDICESIFKEKINYDRHMNEVHIFNNKYNCHICKGLFMHKGRLRRHLREKHENYKPKAFNDSSPILEEITNIDDPSSTTNKITDTVKSQILQASAIKKKRYHFNKNKLRISKRIGNKCNNIKPRINKTKKKRTNNRKINKKKQFIHKTIVHTFEDVPQSDRLNYVCNKCKIKFTSKEKLILHDKLKHRTMKLRHVCLKCGDTFDTYSKLLFHIKKYHNINLFKLFKCDLCPVVFKHEDKLSQHYKLKHNIHLETELDSCLQLNTESSEPVSFIEAMHACCICMSLFTSKEMLGRHIELEHILSKDARQKCEQCGQITSTC